MQFVSPRFRDQRETVAQLKSATVLSVSAIESFYFDYSAQSDLMKLYIFFLEYLRLLLLVHIKKERSM